jgi:hypothetical protein
VNGTLEIKTTASVQGMAVKEASRALINMFYGQNAIPSAFQIGAVDYSQTTDGPPSLNPGSEAASSSTKMRDTSVSEDVAIAVISSASSLSTVIAPTSNDALVSAPQPVNCSASIGSQRRANLRSQRFERVATASTKEIEKPLAAIIKGRSRQRQQSLSIDEKTNINKLTSLNDSSLQKTNAVKGATTATLTDSSCRSSDDVDGATVASHSREIIQNRSESSVCANDIGLEADGAAQVKPINEADKSPRVFPVGELFLLDRVARPWIFSYYHKSGNIKDQFAAYVRFNSTGTCLYGRGQNQEGVFVMYGSIETTIIGFVWMISCIYLSTVSIIDSLRMGLQHWIVHNVGPLEFSDATVPVVLESDDGDFVVAEEYFESNDAIVTAAFSLGSASGIKRKTSMVHMAYWADGIVSDNITQQSLSGVVLSAQQQTLHSPLPDTESDFSGLIESSVNSCGVQGLGLWGVWEMADNG